MTAELPHKEHRTDSDAADHVAEARRRARQVIAGESHLGAIDDWRGALVSARDAILLIWLTWISLLGFGSPPFAGAMLVAMAAGFALLVGISRGRSTHAQVQYYAAELDRERAELRDDFENERDEIRALYAAKGFREPLLSQVVDTLSADDDRLLKVMMEEELGLSMHHINHPLLVGLWNAMGAAGAGLALALPMIWLLPTAAQWWMPAGGSVLLVLVAGAAGFFSRRSMTALFAASIIMAVVTGGVAYYLSRWLAGVVGGFGA